MIKRFRIRQACAFGLFGLGALTATAGAQQTVNGIPLVTRFGQNMPESWMPMPDRPYPGEIPIPEIPSPHGKLPGPNELPSHPDMPDLLTMKDGTKVTTKEQWAKRREEIKAMVEYYSVGTAPPPPGNVKGTETSSQVSPDGKFKTRVIHLTFGPEEKLTLDFSLVTPTDGGPQPVVITLGGGPQPSTPLPQLPGGALDGGGNGRDVQMAVGPADPNVSGGPRGGGARRGGFGRGGAPTTGPIADGAAPATQPGGRRGRGGFGFGGGAPTTGPLADGAAPATQPGGRGGFGGGRGGGNLGSNYALQHGFALISFNTGQCAADSTLRMPDGSWAFRHVGYFPAYPGYDWGVLRGWAWGVSRIVDYLQTDPSVDKTKIIVTGVSRAGKGAMVAAAFDERIAMAAPVASSGGGTPAYRFSGVGRGGKEGLTEMEGKYPNYWTTHLHEFWGQQDKLPFDQHFFPALVAPRPFVALEGIQDENVVAYGVKMTITSAQPVYDFLGVPDKIGVSWAERPHAFVKRDQDAMMAFADKHLLGKTVDWNFREYPSTAVPATRPAGQ